MARNFDPFREMDRMMNQFARPAAPAAMGMDLYRNGDNFIADIDLPGVDPDSIDIDIDDRTLTVRAERHALKEEGIKWLAHERPTGTFARQLNLGRGLALDKISASYTDGVLTVTIPMAEESKPRKIEVAHKPRPEVIEAGEQGE